MLSELLGSVEFPHTAANWTHFKIVLTTRPERPDNCLLIAQNFLTTYTEKAFLRTLSKTTHKAVEGVFIAVLGHKCNKVELVLLEKLLGW